MVKKQRISDMFSKNFVFLNGKICEFDCSEFLAPFVSRNGMIGISEVKTRVEKYAINLWPLPPHVSILVLFCEAFRATQYSSICKLFHTYTHTILYTLNKYTHSRKKSNNPKRENDPKTKWRRRTRSCKETEGVWMVFLTQKQIVIMEQSRTSLSIMFQCTNSGRHSGI